MDKSAKNNKYETISKIGEGAYGAVYKARNTLTNQLVALKVSKLQREDQGIPSTTLREICILKSLSHPNIVRLYDVQLLKDRKDSMIRLVFEFVDQDLAKFIKRNKGMPESQYKKIFLQIVQGIKHLHDRQIFHRDLKPQNILIGQDRVVKIADFGLSRVIFDPARTFSKEIQTLWYRSPELLMGAKYYGREIDVWSLGCILYELAEGSVLFRGDSQIGQIFKIFQVLGTPKTSEYPSCVELPYFRPSFPKMKFSEKKLNNLSESGCDLIFKMLRHNPKQRISIQEIMQHEFFKEIN